VLKSIQPIDIKDTVLGQYVGKPDGKGDEGQGYFFSINGIIKYKNRSNNHIQFQLDCMPYDLTF
jgi:hypothetical protein